MVEVFVPRRRKNNACRSDEDCSGPTERVDSLNRVSQASNFFDVEAVERGGHQKAGIGSNAKTEVWCDLEKVES